MGISCFSKEIHLYLFTWMLIAMLQKRTFHTWSPVWTRLKNKYRESSCKQNTPHPNFHVWFEVLEAYSHGNRAVDRMVFPVTIIQWSSDRIQYWFITIPQLHVQQLVIHSNGTAVFRSLATVPGLKFYHMQIVKTWQISLWVPRDSDHGNFPLIGRNIKLSVLRTKRERAQTSLVCRGLRCSLDRTTWPKKVVSSAVARSHGRAISCSPRDLLFSSVATLAAKILTQQRSWSQARLRFMFPTMCTRQPSIFLG